MTQDEIELRKLELERDKLKLAQDTLSLERQKYQDTLSLERQKYEVQNRTLSLETGKSRWTPVSIIGSTLVAVLGLLVNGCLQRDIEHRTASDNFKLKAAEIVMNSNGIDATRNKSLALQRLFPNELDQNFGLALPQSTSPERPELVGDPEPKQALIKLLAEYPAQREQIIKDWSTVFTDKWINCLRAPNPCQ